MMNLFTCAFCHKSMDLSKYTDDELLDENLLLIHDQCKDLHIDSLRIENRNLKHKCRTAYSYVHLQMSERDDKQICTSAEHTDKLLEILDVEKPLLQEEKFTDEFIRIRKRFTGIYFHACSLFSKSSYDVMTKLEKLRKALASGRDDKLEGKEHLTCKEVVDALMAQRKEEEGDVGDSNLG